MPDFTSVLAPIAMHFLAIFAAGATVALLSSFSGAQLVGIQQEDD